MGQKIIFMDKGLKAGDPIIYDWLFFLTWNGPRSKFQAFLAFSLLTTTSIFLLIISYQLQEKWLFLLVTCQNQVETSSKSLFHSCVTFIVVFFITVRWSRKLVWSDITGPDRTPPTFWSDCWNPLQTEGSSVVLRMISDDFRCLDVLSCFLMFSAWF